MNGLTASKRAEVIRCLVEGNSIRSTVRVTGAPDPEQVSTSYAERSNLTLRMGVRRFTRLTNAFSKKVENNAAHVTLHVTYCNFVRIH